MRIPRSRLLNSPLPPISVEDREHILRHTAHIWRELEGARIFVTGGTGFFGSWLLESIAAANDSMKVGVVATVLSRDPRRFLDRVPQLANRAEFEWLCGHPANFSFPSAQHDYLLHMATATSAYLDRTDPIEMMKAKLFGIAHVLDYARYAKVRRVLVTSSGAVYGPQPAGLDRIPETHSGAPDSLEPTSAYGNGKRMVEQMCALAPEVETVIARCFSFIGPHLPLDGRFAAGNFLRDAIAGGPIVIQGDGTSIRGYLYVADLVIWLLTLLLKGKPRRAYNVGSDEAISTLCLAKLIAESVPHRPEISVLHKQSTATKQDIYVPDISRARSEIGLEVFHTLPHAVRKAIAWQQNADQQRVNN